MFYYFRPKASAARSPRPTSPPHHRHALAVARRTTTGKFPEYDKVWEDGTLNVVAIFGKYEDGATTAGDAGIAAYNEFVGAMNAELAAAQPHHDPGDVPDAPGVARPTSSSTRRSPDGKKIHVVALLADNVNTGLRSRRSAPATRRCPRAPTSSSTTATPASAPTSARSPRRASGSPASTWSSS